MLRPEQIRRYARHVLLPDVGGTGQARLLASRVTLDLGDDPAALVEAVYLAAAGVGTLALAGGARQVGAADVAACPVLTLADLGRPLGAALAEALAALNPDCAVRSAEPSDPPAAPRPAGDPALPPLVAGGAAACRVVHALATGAAP